MIIRTLYTRYIATAIFAFAAVAVSAAAPHNTAHASGSLAVLLGQVGADIRTDVDAAVSVPGVNVDANASVGATSTMGGDGSGVGTGTAVTSSTTMTGRTNAESMLSEPAVLAEVQSDENVSRVESDEDEVSVWYKMPARFLGFIPMNMTVRTTVGADGEVKVDRPWYRFLVKADNVERIEPAVKSQVSMMVGDSAFSADGEYRLTESARAALIWAVHDALSATTTAEADASMEGSVSY